MDVLSLTLLLSASAQAACPEAGVDLGAGLRVAVEDYTAFELDGFEERAEALSACAATLDAPITPEQARDLHLVVGLAAWLDQDPRRMAAAVRGVYALDPGFEPGVEIAPSGSRIRAVFDTARAAEPGPVTAIALPGLWVDGAQAPGGLPSERAALVQWTTADGAVRGWYLDGLGVPEALITELRLATPVAPPPRHRSRWLAAAGAGAAVLGGGALVGAYRLEARFWDSYDPDEAQRLYRANRTLALTGTGLLAVGGAGVTGALVLWEF